jgi:beta-lactamase class A
MENSVVDKILQYLLRVEKESDVVLAISAIHMPSNQSIQYNENREFLLCSTYKLPMALCLLKQVEAKKLTLSDELEINQCDLRPGLVSTLSQMDYSVPVKMTILNLLRFMLQESCNTATDKLLSIIGGPQEVMRCLQSLAISGLRVDRSTIEIIAALEVVKMDSSSHFTAEEYQALAAKIPAKERELARQQFKKDKRDNGTALAMTQLLQKIYLREVLDNTHTELLLKIMQGCKTGASRIKAILPPGTKVAHKTGTANGYANDAGVIYLDNACIILSIFIDGIGMSAASNDRVIAEVARTIYDYFCFSC